MDLFFNNGILESSEEISFSIEETKHLMKVLRKDKGDHVKVTNGEGLEWIGKISSVISKHAKAKKIKTKKMSRSNDNIHIAISPTKSNSRMEWFVEKVTELGVNQITPIICFHSERRSLNLDRYQKIIISAIKQSKQFFIPRLNPVISFNDFIESHASNIDLYIAHCHDMKRRQIHEINNFKEDVIVMVGPEGDFSVKEIEFAVKKNAIPISLGANILRTETAGILATNNIIFQKHILKY